MRALIQTDVAPSVSETRPRALVLSAGGMFGSYQAGAWEVLADVFKPDIVVGASVGSLNGYLIASGVPPAQLVSRWRSLQDVHKVKWRIPTHPSEGLIDTTVLEQLIRGIIDDSVPQCRYALVATQMPALKQRVFEWPDIGWQHIAASCGVPGFLPTQRIDGTAYCDGGLLDPLPLSAALQMGAREIVAVNLLKHRPAPLRAFVKGLQICSGYSRASADEVSMIEISPSEPLGSARDSMYWTAENTRRWIALGRKDAQAAADRIREFAHL